jgi:hypothetical protein
MATPKGLLGEEMILSSLSSFSINLLVLTYNYNCVNTVIALVALILNRFEIIILNKTNFGQERTSIFHIGNFITDKNLDTHVPVAKCKSSLYLLAQ